MEAVVFALAALSHVGLPGPGTELVSLVLASRLLTTDHQGIPI